MVIWCWIFEVASGWSTRRLYYRRRVIRFPRDTFHAFSMSSWGVQLLRVVSLVMLWALVVGMGWIEWLSRMLLANSIYRTPSHQSWIDYWYLLLCSSCVSSQYSWCSGDIRTIDSASSEEALETRGCVWALGRIAGSWDLWSFRHQESPITSVDQYDSFLTMICRWYHSYHTWRNEDPWGNQHSVDGWSWSGEVPASEVHLQRGSSWCLHYSGLSFLFSFLGKGFV